MSQSHALVIYPTVEELIVISIGRTAPPFICFVPISIASLRIPKRANCVAGLPVKISASHTSIQAYQFHALSDGVQFGIISSAITEFDCVGRKLGTGKVVMAVRVETPQERAVASFCCIFPTNVTFPLSSSVAPEFCMVLPHVPSIRTRALSVELAAPITLPAPAVIARLSA